jgi:hypothetical protein
LGAKSTLLLVLTLLGGQLLRAEIVSQALLAFPAKTESIEYDNLFDLRRLPNYPVLRQRFAGKQLDDAKAALLKLGIPESQVHEIVMGTSRDAFYGLVSGTFSGTQAVKTAKKNGIWPHVVDNEKVYCPKGTSCVVFLEDSLAAFAQLNQVKPILDARLGTIARLSSNPMVFSLMNSTQRRCPVRGVVYGSQLNTVISDALQDQSSFHIDWSQFTPNIRAFSYSVSMDSLAHVTAKLQCKSATTAAILRQMLGALGGVETMASKVGKDAAAMPFQNIEVSASGDLVDLKMDTPLPTS